jgi:hypothetical protein
MANKKIGGVTGPKGSMPTPTGWVCPKTGHLLKSQRITQEQLDAYNGVQMIAEPVYHPAMDPAPIEMADLIDDEVEELVEAPAAAPKAKKSKKSKKFGLFG